LKKSDLSNFSIDHFPFEKLQNLRVLKLGENLLEDIPTSIGEILSLKLIELEKNP
jgi:Leucine-rich repeat (LRR) protein